MSVAVLAQSISEHEEEAERRRTTAERRSQRAEDKKQLALMLSQQMRETVRAEEQVTLDELAGATVRIEKPELEEDPRDQWRNLTGLDSLLDPSSDDFQKLKTICAAMTNALEILAGFEDQSYCVGRHYFLLWLQLKALIKTEFPGDFFLEARHAMLSYMDAQEQKNRHQFIQLLAVALLSSDQRVDHHEAEIPPLDMQDAFAFIERSMPEPKVDLDLDLFAEPERVTLKYGKAATTAKSGGRAAPKISSRAQAGEK
jgi:hypothetical protein